MANGLAQELAQLQQALQQQTRESQRLTTALQESEARYWALVDGSLQGVCIHRDGAVQSANLALATIFGYTRAEDLIGQNFWMLVAPHERLRLEAYTRLYVHTALTPERCEFEGVRQDGAPIWLETVMVPLVWRGVPAVLATFLDVTEHRRLEVQLRRAQRLEAIGTLAGGIAHDFNNILAAILGYTELAIDDVPEESVIRRRLQRVLVAGERAKELVRQILAFSRHHEQERQPVEFSSLVKEVLKLLRASFPATIDIQQDVDVAAGIVLADPTQMHHMLMNLCINAEYAMRTVGGVLEVRLEEIEVIEVMRATHPPLKRGSYLRLAIRDTGHGMTPDVLEHIYDPFFTTKAMGEETGTGLAVVQGIVINHDGAIAVMSTPGEGTTFEVYLPRYEKSATPTAAPEEPVPGGHERILFVDDEEELARLGRAMLERLGYQTVVCTSSRDALALFGTAPQEFDLIITDHTMPAMTGATLIQELRRFRPELPAILCTGFSHTMDAEKAHALGIDAFLLKPLLLRDLGLAIRRVLERRAAKRS